MTTVDTKGRVTLPKELRERLGLKPGAEVEISDENGRVVIERERDPEDTIAELERRVEGTYELDSPVDEPRSIASAHLEMIRCGAKRDE